VSFRLLKDSVSELPPFVSGPYNLAVRSKIPGCMLSFAKSRLRELPCLPRPPVGTGAGRQGRFSTGYGVIASLSHWEKRKRGPRVPNEDLFHRNMIETGREIE